MNFDTPNQVVARVVAWHNRWPWARRIGPEHVRHIGVLETVCASAHPDTRSAQSGLGRLGRRVSGWLEAARQLPGACHRAWRRTCAILRSRPGRAAAPPADRHGTGRLPPPATVMRFAAQHGVARDAAPPHWPRRKAVASSADVRCLLTAAIDLGAQGKRRVLLGAADGAVVGQRVASLPRSAALGGLATTVIIAVVGLASLGGPAPDPQAAAAAMHARADAASAPQAAASAQPAASAGAAAATAGDAAASSATARLAAPDGEPAGMAMGPNGAAPAAAAGPIRPDLAASYREALARGDTLGPARAAEATAATSPVADAPRAASNGTGAAEGSATRSAPLSAQTRHIAVLAPLADRRADADATLARMRQVAASLEPTVPALQAEVHATPQGLQPVLWPFATVEAADRMRLALAQAGVRTILLEF